MGEFDLIKRYFQRQDEPCRSDILLSVGDDCAVTILPENQQLAITTDTLVEGTHFLPSISPEDLAYKSVAVNLSDLAAMGATPRWVSLALTLPNLDQPWLSAFSQSLFQVLDRYQVSLIGGDTTKGHRSITLTAQGFIPKEQGLFRHQAQVGDFIYVSGNIGESAAGLDLLLKQKVITNSSQQHLIQRHLRPTPRVELGLFLNQYSRCAVDISDGLLADLGHILERSQCGAEIWLENIPLSDALKANFSIEQAQQFALTGGEDYELCFTITPEKQQAFEKACTEHGFSYFCIGKIVADPALRLLDNGKEIVAPTQIGFDHFG